MGGCGRSYCDGNHSGIIRAFGCNKDGIPGLCGATGVAKSVEVIHGGGGWSSHAGLETEPATGDIGEYRHKELRESHVRNVKEVQESELFLEGVLCERMIGIQKYALMPPFVSGLMVGSSLRLSYQ